MIYIWACSMNYREIYCFNGKEFLPSLILIRNWKEWVVMGRSECINFFKNKILLKFLNNFKEIENFK